MTRREEDNNEYEEQIIHSRFSLPEIDKIMEDRSRGKGDLIFRGQRKNPCTSAIPVAVQGNNTTGEDLFNKLPEELLSTITSFLTWKEAVKTSILSKRWRYLYRTHKNLSFDRGSMTRSVSSILEIDERKRNIALQRKRYKFVTWVDDTLDLHCGPEIESFRIKYFLGEENDSDIDRWIQFAISKGVQNLHIILNSSSDVEIRKSYKFPYQLFAKNKEQSTLKHLTLALCTMDLPPSYEHFSSLVSLTLVNSTLTQELVQNILSNCVSLEWFSINYCTCPVRLKFGGGGGGSGSGSSLRLKYLNLSGCLDLKEIEIYDAIDIASIDYMGTMFERFSFKSSAQLKRLCLYVHTAKWYESALISYVLDQLSSDFPQLETLSLTAPNFKEDMIPNQLPTFAKLKHLVLMFTGGHRERILRPTSILLKASPILHKLELHLPWRSKDEMTRQDQWAVHEHLKQVEIYNFRGDQMEVELLVNLVKTCIALETIKVGRDCQVYLGDGKWLSGLDHQKCITRDRGLEILQEIVPSSIELTVL